MSVVLVKTENSRRLKQNRSFFLGRATHSQTRVPTVDEDLRFRSLSVPCHSRFLSLAITASKFSFFSFDRPLDAMVFLPFVLCSPRFATCTNAVEHRLPFQRDTDTGQDICCSREFALFVAPAMGRIS